MSDTEILLEKALKGTAEDYVRLAKHALTNDKNSLVAFEWFKRAADTGHPESIFMIGYMYLKGISRNRNIELALQWLERASEQEYPKAFYYLGVLYGGLNTKGELDDTIASFYGRAKELNFTDDDAMQFEQTIMNPPSQYSQGENKPAIFSRTSSSNVRVNEYPDPVFDDESEVVSAGSGEVEPISYRITEYDNSFDYKEALNNLIGLENIKTDLESIACRVEVEQKRRAMGLITKEASSNHFCFMGNPGTGKSEVARLIGGLLKKSGVLKTGHVVEVSRAELIGNYIGHTATRTNMAVKAALGGVLFVDEAYAINQDSGYDFGSEAISTLIKAMEDYRDNLVVIFAGYQDEMRYFLDANPGIRSRIRHKLDFKDYTSHELLQIFKKMAEDNDYVVSEECEVRFLKLIKETETFSKHKTGNARFVRNILEKAIEKLALRVSRLQTFSREDLQTLLFNDIPIQKEAL